MRDRGVVAAAVDPDAVVVLEEVRVELEGQGGRGKRKRKMAPQILRVPMAKFRRSTKKKRKKALDANVRKLFLLS